MTRLSYRNYFRCPDFYDLCGTLNSISSNIFIQSDLHTMEKDMYQAKRSRDQQLNETRKDVERRKESVDKAHEKRVFEMIL